MTPTWVRVGSLGCAAEACCILRGSITPFLVSAAVTCWTYLLLCWPVFWNCKEGIVERRSCSPAVMWCFGCTPHVVLCELLVLVQDVFFVVCWEDEWSSSTCAGADIWVSTCFFQPGKKECNSKVKLSELIVKYCNWSATGWPSVCRSVLLKLFLFLIFFTTLCHQSFLCSWTAQGRIGSGTTPFSFSQPLAENIYILFEYFLLRAETIIILPLKVIPEILPK